MLDSRLTEKEEDKRETNNTTGKLNLNQKTGITKSTLYLIILIAFIFIFPSTVVAIASTITALVKLPGKIYDFFSWFSWMGK